MLNLTTEEFAKINSKVSLSLLEALKGFSYEQAIELVESENLKRAFQILGSASAEETEETYEQKEMQKFLKDRSLEIFEDLEQMGPVPVAKTQLIPFSKGNEWVVGDEMLKRSRAKFKELKKAGAGWRQALSDFRQRDEIPEEDGDKVRLYTETILRRRDSGSLCVLVLYRIAFTGEWSLYYYWLDRGFDSVCRAVGCSCE